MSTPAVQVSASPPPPSVTHQPDAAARSGAGAAFAAIFSALAGEAAQPRTQSGSTKDAPTADGRNPRRDEAPTSEDAGSIDPDLAGLILGALPMIAQFAQQGSSSAQHAATAPLSALTQGASSRGPLWRAQTGEGAAANASPTKGGAATSTTAANGSGPALSADPALAAVASAATNSVGPSFANAGAVQSPQEAKLTEAQLAAAESATDGQASINFSVVRNRTHLGVDGAAQTVAKDPILRAQSTVGGATQAATTQPSAALGAVAALTTQDKSSSAPRSIANRAAAQSGLAPTASVAGAAASSVAPAAPASSGRNQSWSQKQPGQEDGQKAAPAAKVEANGAASLASSAAASASAMTSIGPVTIGQLADTLASQASALVSQAAPTDAGTTAAASVTGAQPVKELEIQLDPSELGAVTVKMRLSDGKLSVVMEVSKSSTLKAVESDRDTIANRLGSSVQSLESLVIRPSTASQAAPDSNSAAGQKSEGRNNAQSDARGSGNSQGGQGAPGRDSSAGQWNSQTPSRQPVAGRGFGDMVV